MIFQIYRVIHLLITGAITILISTFFAGGAIGENFTDNPFPYPGWLLPILVWGIGAVLALMPKWIKPGLIISALPVLFFAVLFIFAYYK